jgi:LmbE family N-acetylglucosaminyl deacetylase
MRTQDNVLVIGAHPDDEVYGPGATISSMTYLKYWKVHLLTFTDGCNSEEDDVVKILEQWHKACEILGIKDRHCALMEDQKLDSYDLKILTGLISDMIEKIKPTIVITHNITDLNRDHRLVSEATMVACRPKPHFPVKELWMYEILSSTDWGFGQFGSFEPNMFFEVHPKFFYKKKDAMMVYKNEMENWPHSRSIGNVWDHAMARGRTIGSEYAEAFKVVWRKAGPIHEKGYY